MYIVHLFSQSLLRFFYLYYPLKNSTKLQHSLRLELLSQYKRNTVVMPLKMI